jgi:hypothetical protein
MHNERLADPLDVFTREIAKVAKKRNKTETDHLRIARLEFYGGLYTVPPLEGEPDEPDDQATVCLPAWNLLRCLQDGATRHKRGRDVLRGVYPLVTEAELVYDGPGEVTALWQHGGFSLRKTVGVQRSRTTRTRPIFHDWQIELPVEVDMTIWDLDTLANCWKDAGVYSGIGEMRPVFGRFKGTIVVVEFDADRVVAEAEEITKAGKAVKA